MAAASSLDIRLMNATSTLLYALAALACVALLLVGLVRLPVFSLRGITVEGEVAHSSAASLRAHAIPRLRGNFFTLDLQEARAAFEAVPWVSHAAVRRVWPNRLHVRLKEHQAAALWGEGELVDEEGVVFAVDPGDVADQNLPELSGPPGSAPKVLALSRQLDRALDRIRREVKALAFTESGSWHLELDDGAEIELGRGTPEEVMTRMARFVATIPQITSRYQAPLVHADLRYNSGYAVRLKGVTTTLASPVK